MGSISNDCRIIVTRNKESLDFHTPGWKSMIVDVTAIDGGDKKWFLNKFASSV